MFPEKIEATSNQTDRSHDCHKIGITHDLANDEPRLQIKLAEIDPNADPDTAVLGQPRSGEGRAEGGRGLSEPDHALSSAVGVSQEVARAVGMAALPGR